MIPRPENHHHVRLEEAIAHQAALFVSRISNGTSLITVTRCVLSQKDTQAELFITVFPDDKAEEALQFLSRQDIELRDHLKQTIRARAIPFIRFSIDYGEKNRQHLDDLSRASEGS